jgi:hypothetical protein
VDAGVHEVVIPAADASAALAAGTAGVPPEKMPQLYVAPWVAPVLADPAEPSPPGQLGAARPVMPAAAAQQPQPTGDVEFTYPAGSQTEAFAFQPEPEHGGRAVWFATELSSQNGIRFDNPHPGFHVVVRPLTEGDRAVFPFRSAPLLPGARYRLVAHVGFSGGSDAANSADTAMEYWVIPLMPGPPVQHQRVEASPWNPVEGPPRPLDVLQSDLIDVVPGPPVPRIVIVRFEVERGALDPLHPPALFGMRLVQVP